MSMNSENDPNSAYSDPYSDPNVPFQDFPDNPSFDHDIAKSKERQIFKLLNIYLSVSSIIGGVIVLLIIMFMYFYDKKLVNRVSLRLTAMISFVDILSALTVIAYAIYRRKDSLECTSIGAGLSFFPQFYLFLTVMIAFNLQIVFLHRKKVSSFSDRWYIPVAFLMALATNIPALAYNRFGFDESTIDCTYRDHLNRGTSWWKLWTFFAPLALSMIYCTIVLLIVVCKLIFEHRQLAEAIHSQSSATLSAKARRQKLLLLKLVSRISLYAAIPLLTVSGILVENVWITFHGNEHNHVPSPLVYWAILGSCLPGFFNCIAFLFDPAIHNAFRKVKKDLIEKHGYLKKPVETAYTPTSPPTTPSEAIYPNSLPNSSHFPPSPTYYPPPSPNMTRITVTPISPISPYSLYSPYSPMNSSRVGPNDASSRRENFSFLRWFVRTFLDKKVKLPMVSISSPSITSPSLTSASLGSDQQYSSVTINTGTISGQSFGHDYRKVELSSPKDKKRKTYTKRVSKQGPRPLNLEYTTSTTVTSSPSASTSPSVLYEQNPFNNSGSYLIPPVMGNTTINIHVHQYPGSAVTHIETDIPIPLSGVPGVSSVSSVSGVSPIHRRSDSVSSTDSRDSVDNELAAY